MHRAISAVRAFTNKGQIEFIRCDVSNLKWVTVSAIDEVVLLHGMHLHFSHLLTLCRWTACRAVREFADDYKRSGRKLHCLVNNAGTALPPHSITENGFEVCLCALEHQWMHRIC